MSDQLHIAPGFVPTMFGAAEAPGLGPDGVQVQGAPYDRRPRTSSFTITTPNSASSFGYVTVTVGGPSLVKLTNTNLGTGIINRGTIDVFWRPFADSFNPPTEIFVPEFTGRNNFVGPYAWLPRAGQYRITVGTDLDAAQVFSLQGMIQEGVSFEEYLGLINSPASSQVRVGENSLPGGTTLAIGGTSSAAITLFRSLRIFNAGAASAIIRFGYSGAISLPSGGTAEWNQQYLGRHTLTATSAAAAQLNIWLALW